MTKQQTAVVWFEELGSGDVWRVGGKNASLGEMIRALKDEGVRVPGVIQVKQRVAEAEAQRRTRAKG
jgi:phosphoenolpyruvate synthase/pyruvate phosphate dikinase